MKFIAYFLAFLAAAPAAASTSYYDSVGPWSITMPQETGVSCIAGRLYGETIMSISMAPDYQNVWSIWLTFYARPAAATQPREVHSRVLIGDGVALDLTGLADGRGAVVFWTPMTEQTLAALETSALLTVSTQSGDHLFPLDGIDRALTVLGECWEDKRERDNPEL